MGGVASSLPELSSGEPEILPSPPRAALAGVSRCGGHSVSLEGARSSWLPGLSIVLPCLNEAGNLLDMVHDALIAADRVSLDTEVVIVDDGSTDGTARLAARLAEGEPRVRLVMHLTNRGYGAAVRTGIGASRMPYVLLTDADLQFDLAELGRLVSRLSSADAVVGYRLRRNDPLVRRAAAAAWNRLVRALYGLPFKDVDCAFKLFPRELLEQLELVSSGALFSTELLVRSRATGATVAEVGVRHYPRISGRPSGGNPRVVMRAFRELARLHRSLHRAATAPTP
jgi:glycosyltransferase involved in cell wall biosynthesis